METPSTMKNLTTHSIAIALIAALVALAACGEPADPSGDDNNANNMAENNDNDTTNNDNTSNGETSDNGNTSNGNTSNDNTSNGNTSNGNTSNGNTSNGNTNGLTCEDISMFTGQIGREANGFGGGVFSTEQGEYAADSGIAAVLAAVDQGVMDGTIVDKEAVELTGDDRIDVTGAIVTSTSGAADGSKPARYWFQDQQGAIYAFLGDQIDSLSVTDADGNEVTLRTGQQVDFTVTGIGTFDYSPQITDLENVTVTNPEATVGVVDVDGVTISIEEHFGKVARVYGTLGASSECGVTCWELEYEGASGPETITLRTGDRFLETGDCVSYTGPVGAFPGPYVTEDEMDDRTPSLQLNIANDAWLGRKFKQQ